MSYDINILALKQTDKPTSLPFHSIIEVRNETDEVLRYLDIWSYMTQSVGCWYCLGREEEGLFSALSIVDADFGSDTTNIPLPYWIKDDEDIKSNIIPLNVYDEYQADFLRILKHLIYQSPVRTIMFLGRFQSYDEEVVCGVLKLDEFWRLHNERKILFNVCYLIKE